MALPCRTIFPNASSRATCQRTDTGSAGIPPVGVWGSGASRVQSTTPPGNGSPEATPSVKGGPASFGPSRVTSRGERSDRGTATTRPTPAATPRNSRRFTRAGFLAWAKNGEAWDFGSATGAR